MSDDRYNSVEEILDDDALGLPAGITDPAELRRAIEQELKELQRDSDTGTPPRYYKLIEARDAAARLTDGSQTSELVAMREQNRVLTDLMVQQSKLLDRSANSGAEDRRDRVAAERVDRVRLEVRNRRTIPAAGVAAVLTFLWTQKSEFGISPRTNTGYLDPATAIYLCLIGALLLVWALSIRLSHRDQRTVRSLYDPEVQTTALNAATGERRPFTRSDFARQLLDAAENSARAVLSPPFHRGRAASRLLRQFQTVDLLNEAKTATDIALQRFIAEGWLLANRTKENSILYELIPLG